MKVPTMRPPRMPSTRGLVKPNYSARTPIVNDAHFTDTPTPTPTIASQGFNPGQKDELLPGGPPRYIQPPGRRVISKGLSNKRINDTL